MNLKGFLLVILTSLNLLESFYSLANEFEFDFEEAEIEGEYVVRKCCPSGHYYNLQSQSCVLGAAQDYFTPAVRKYLIKGNVTHLHIVTGRLTECPESEECPETYLIGSDRTNTLRPNGILYEHFFSLTYDVSQYCLDMVGMSPYAVSLSLALCLHETKALSKCCPNHSHFDSVTNKCARSLEGTDVDSVLHATDFHGEQQDLNYRFDLQCLHDFPQKIRLRDAYIDPCNNICLKASNKCYSVRKYCLDNVSDGLVEPSAYVCADNVTKKCCKNEIFDEGYCTCAVI